MSKQTWTAQLTCSCGHQFEAVYTHTYDPGVHTFRNGDPGYPSSSEGEFGDGFPENNTCPDCGLEWTEEDFTRFEDQAAASQPEPEYEGPDYDDGRYDDDPNPYHGDYSE